MDDHPYLYCSPPQLSPLLGKAATSSATYQYDDSGSRIEETTITGTNAPVATYFLVDTQTQTGYSQVIEQGTAVGTPTVSYVWGLNLIEQNNASGTPNAGNYYFIVDGHGSTVALTEGSGNVVQTFHYDGFGNALGFTPSTAITQYLYTQQYYDLASNTYYDWARNYNPTTGLFTQADFGYSGSLANPMRGLPYAFTGGDLINMLDPTGHFGLTDVTVSFSINLALAAGIDGTTNLLGYTHDSGWQIAFDSTVGGILGAVWNTPNSSLYTGAFDSISLGFRFLPRSLSK